MVFITGVLRRNSVAYIPRAEIAGELYDAFRSGLIICKLLRIGTMDDPLLARESTGDWSFQVGVCCIDASPETAQVLE